MCFVCFVAPSHCRSTCNGWLSTCALALLVEATVQQPVILLVTGVLGDFVEESADILLELFT